MRLKCYFAHPHKAKDTQEAKRIIDILKSRKVKVVNPFDGEDEICKKYGVETYYPSTPYKLGREFWIKDLRQLDNCNMALFWLPKEYTPKGCFAELQHAIEYQNRKIRRYTALKMENGYFIQIITEFRHPIIAWALCYNNQLYDNIDDFERHRQAKWK